MIDRELLEKAATAAGFGLPGKGDHDEIGRQYDYHLGLWVMWDYGQWAWFRPHIDEGQALRLAIRLEIPVSPYTTYTIAGDQHAEANGDRYAATLRAIVRAAAALAPKTIPSQEVLP